MLSSLASGQTADTDKPVPILSGSIGTFSFVTAGQNLIDTQINPVLLVPLGDHWLIESRAEFEGQFQRPPGGGPYGGPVDKHVDYAQVDYIASPYLTVTAGRFLTPFGIFNERLYPVWIRSLQPDPLILPINTAPSDGFMFRGGFPVKSQANMNYAAYVSTTSIGIGSVAMSLAGFVLLYSTLAVVDIYLMVKYIKLGPEGAEEAEAQSAAAMGK